MILLYSILLFSIINVSYQELPTTTDWLQQQGSQDDTSDDIQDLRLLISQLNTKFENQNVKIAQQDIDILKQTIEIKDLKTKIEELEKSDGHENQLPSTRNLSLKGTGSLFTRWGRIDCPRNISELVYSGITGGSSNDHTGGAAEYVCLPPDPTWNANKHFNGPFWGYMYGTEYDSVPKAIKDYKVPCVVCRTNQFSTVLMIPARAECYQGWQKAYSGELVSGYYNHRAASQYICLDDNPQIHGTKSYNSGKLVYPVRAKCGALPCPPYEDNTLLACVVCLK